MITFFDCLLLCAQNADFVTEFDRLMGCRVGEIGSDQRPPIVRMIDQATGYDVEILKAENGDIGKFIEFVDQFVWQPLVTQNAQ